MTNTALKIIIVGESGVGKTCLLLRYVDNKFIFDHISTVGSDYRVKHTEINGEPIDLHIWDTAGQERFRSITKTYFNSAHGAIVVFDVSNRISFDNVSYWVNAVKEKDNSIQFILVGNKIDLKREITNEEAKEFADSLDIQYFETSAKDGTNITEAFQYLAEKAYKSIKPTKNQIIKPSVNVSETEKKKCDC
ncbi:hypothetical protein M9Y10_015727 [Tritrichomonas musculus]|uniref:Small GTP-binding protein n=1 Tax=Tritrichomonas musculus TaxID=1915356 RepID=A0ABR2L334_9EUKA